MNSETTKTNYTEYMKELINTLTNNLDENSKNIVINNIAKVNWNKYFNRTCSEILKNGNVCSTIAKPGYDYCQRHLNLKLLKIQKQEMN